MPMETARVEGKGKAGEASKRRCCDIPEVKEKLELEVGGPEDVKFDKREALRSPQGASKEQPIGGVYVGKLTLLGLPRS